MNLKGITFRENSNILKLTCSMIPFIVHPPKIKTVREKELVVAKEQGKEWGCK